MLMAVVGRLPVFAQTQLVNVYAKFAALPPLSSWPREGLQFIAGLGLKTKIALLTLICLRVAAWLFVYVSLSGHLSGALCFSRLRGCLHLHG